jgi:hypothetical protein
MSALCQQRTSAPLFGSGGGIKQIEARTVTFGATDALLRHGQADTFCRTRDQRTQSGQIDLYAINSL